VDQTEIEKVADGLLATLRGELGLPRDLAELGTSEKPLLVTDLDDSPSYWLIPIALEDRLLGFLRLGLQGDLLAYGRFGQGQLVRDFPHLSYLTEGTAYREMQKAFGSSHEDIGPPHLVHDGSSERIAWLSRGRSPNGVKVLLFWTFGTSYSRPEAEEPRYGLL
jgi:hypothetical protein